MWLDMDTTAQTAAVTALRFDLRAEYSALGQLLVSNASDTGPDRLPSPGVVTFDPSGGLELAPGTSAFVTDRTYADVAIDVDAPTGELALIVLRDEVGNELEVGGITCPGALATPAAASSLHVKRMGAGVFWAVSSRAPSLCSSGVPQNARLTIGVRGAPGMARSVARNLRVARLGRP